MKEGMKEGCQRYEIYKLSAMKQDKVISHLCVNFLPPTIRKHLAQRERERERERERDKPIHNSYPPNPRTHLAFTRSSVSIPASDSLHSTWFEMVIQHCSGLLVSLPMVP